ncbi:MAG: hypothetical protein JSU81_02335 [Candidatus Coatesbacteria bacterium]|nr:MAG: hypothetical protein JSU81_02335 [Candidatus Coatesbacteria bacterium]
MNEEKATLEPRWLWYLVSFVLPVVGIILGILYRRRENPASRDFAKKTTIAAIVGIVACVVFYVVWFFVFGAAELMG